MHVGAGGIFTHQPDMLCHLGKTTNTCTCEAALPSVYIPAPLRNTCPPPSHKAVYIAPATLNMCRG
eukprot:349916-Chlamydomonas_euryale.AAC.7